MLRPHWSSSFFGFTSYDDQLSYNRNNNILNHICPGYGNYLYWVQLMLMYAHLLISSWTIPNFPKKAFWLRFAKTFQGPICLTLVKRGLSNKGKNRQKYIFLNKLRNSLVENLVICKRCAIRVSCKLAIRRFTVLQIYKNEDKIV